MATWIDEVLPFGRSLEEYQLMFDLTPEDLQKAIADIGAGTASFNAEMTRQGHSVTSVDPIYQLSTAQILHRFEATVDDVFQQIDRTPDAWIWNYHPSPAHLRATRQQVIQTFAADYESGKQQGRYLIGSLPQLDFGDRSFDLALSSYLLFVYSKQFDLDFHIAAIQELCRIAPEVRVFPLLLAETPVRSPYVEPVRQAMAQIGIESQIVQVEYELQRGGNEAIVFRQR